jgi:hypothetical protein
MKNSDDLQKNVPDIITSIPLSEVVEIGVKGKVGKYLKKFIYLSGVVGMTLCLNACVPGYIATTPEYVVNDRPPQPSTFHVWVDGNWLFNRQSHSYVQKVGYWQKPHQNRTYVSGHWQTTPRGNYWSSGHWQKQGYKRH